MSDIKSIYTWDAVPAQRNVTIAELRAGKGSNVFTQVTTNSEDEAYAAGAAGIDMMICNHQNVPIVRASNNTTFLTAAIPLPSAVTDDEVLKAAFKAMESGADSVMTARSMRVVEMLAREDVPVMGHLGLVPRKSIWHGGLRAIGKTADEALVLYERFKALENAGAVSVEAEVIPAAVMAEINKRTGLITVSLGSGTGADVMYLFMEDICGEKPAAPRHARAFGNLYHHYEAIKLERIKALKQFREASLAKTFPGVAESAAIDEDELQRFTEKLD